MAGRAPDYDDASSMRRVRGLALALAAAGALLAGATAAAARSPLELGHFAGYVWGRGAVSSVSATFAVPRIRPGSPPTSLAATWIGAQGPGRAPPFIQIGVNELHLPLSAVHGHLDFYYAFWSDTRRNFRPAFLFVVHPGDNIAASLRRARGGWTLAIVDASTGVRRRFFTRDEAHGAFNLGEFLQEDPTHGGRAAAFAYPRLSGVRFQEMRVNSRTATGLRSQWMSIGRGDVAPSRIAGGAFNVRRHRPSAAVERYLRLALPEDAAAGAFAAGVERWTRSTPPITIAFESAEFVAVMRVFIRGLERGPWPGPAEAPIAVLIASQRAMLHLVTSASNRVPHRLAALKAAVARDSRATGEAGQRVRALLHAPAFN